MIPEYYKTILVLIIFLIFQIDKVSWWSWEGRRCIYWAAIEMKLCQFLNLKQKAKKEKREAFPSIPKELFAISKKTAFKDIEVEKLINVLLTNSRVTPWTHLKNLSYVKNVINFINLKETLQLM